jgi:hypothetical protein
MGIGGGHLVYQYKGLNSQITSYDKLRIEIQIRTVWQHAWATTVEAVSTFTGQALKSSEGDQDWLRLFVLMASAMALIEKRPMVPNTPSNPKQLRQEIIAVSSKLSAVLTLNAHANTVRYVGKMPKAKYLLVHYDIGDQMVYLSGFTEAESQRANEAYTDKEKTKKEGDTIVLVEVGSLKNLTKAYPNFFLDTVQFSRLLDAIVQGASRVAPHVPELFS